MKTNFFDMLSWLITLIAGAASLYWIGVHDWAIVGILLCLCSSCVPYKALVVPAEVIVVFVSLFILSICWKKHGTRRPAVHI